MNKHKKKPARNSKEYRRRRMSKQELENEMFLEQMKHYVKKMQNILKDKNVLRQICPNVLMKLSNASGHMIPSCF